MQPKSVVAVVPLLILGIGLSQAAQMSPPGEEIPIELIRVKQVAQPLSDGAPVALVDVRSRQEYLIRHIKKERSPFPSIALRVGPGTSRARGSWSSTERVPTSWPVWPTRSSMPKGIAILEYSMKGFQAGWSRATLLKGGVPVTMSRLDTVEPIVFHRCFARERRNLMDLI